MFEEQSDTLINDAANSPTLSESSTTPQSISATAETNPSSVGDEKDSQPEPETHEVTDTPVTALLTETVQGIQQVLSEMQILKQDFDTKVKYDESKERIIDALHSELQSYREGLHFKILRPLFIDLISLYDDITRIIENVSREFPDLDSTIISNVQSFADSVEELLISNEVEPFQMEEEIFVANKQRVLRAIPTDSAMLDKHIARRVRKGFRYDNRILRPEVVETYRYIAPE